MSDQLTTPAQETPSLPPQHHGILNQTLEEILQNNKNAQNLIIRSMGITPEKFQEMLKSTTNNPMMQQTIGELFKNGTMQQAAQQGGHVSSAQVEQIVQSLNAQQPEIIQSQPNPSSQPAQTTTQTERASFMQKIKNLFS